MTRILLFLAVVVRSVYQSESNNRFEFDFPWNLKPTNQPTSTERSSAKLGETCRHTLQCMENDINSVCYYDQRYHTFNICSCKSGFRVQVIDNIERCVIEKQWTEEEKEGLTAAPIILCFMGCVIVEGFCLLAFRYWKKRRRNRLLRQDTLNLEATLGTNTPRTPQHIFLPLLITQVESSIVESEENSPPPYSQTAETEDAVVQAEEPPPTYEEAMKLCVGVSSLSPVEESERPNLQRKMSC